MSMAAEVEPDLIVTLQAGVTFRSADNPRGGVLGLLAMASNGKIYGVTVRDALPNVEDGGDILDESGALVGVRFASKPLKREPAAVGEAICRFEIANGVFILPGCGHARALAGAVSPDMLLGRHVLKLNDGERPAIVSRLFASLELFGGSAPPVRLTGAVEIRPEDEGAFSVAGDAGALVVTPSYQPVGLLIAGDADAYVIAPLRDWLLKEQLVPLSAEQAARHNATVSAPFFEAEAIDRRLGSVTGAFSEPPPEVSAADVAQLDKSVSSWEPRHSELARVLGSIG